MNAEDGSVKNTLQYILKSTKNTYKIICNMLILIQKHQKYSMW